MLAAVRYASQFRVRMTKVAFARAGANVRMSSCGRKQFDLNDYRCTLSSTSEQKVGGKKGAPRIRGTSVVNVGNHTMRGCEHVRIIDMLRVWSKLGGCPSEAST